MGIVISYQGTLDDTTQLDNLVADVRLFCQHAGWEFDEVAEPISGVALTTPEEFMGGAEREEKKEKKKDSIPPEKWPEEETFREGGMTIWFDAKTAILLEESMRGVIVHPTGTDSLRLTFDSRGRLCKYDAIPQEWVKGQLKDQKHYFCLPLFCKTTGETDQHGAICVLLRMLRDKYIKTLDVSDETGYFESGDLRKLQDGHAMMAGLVGMMRKSPELLKGVMKAAGLDEKKLEGAKVLPAELGSPRKGRKAKKATVH